MTQRTDPRIAHDYDLIDDDPFLMGLGVPDPTPDPEPQPELSSHERAELRRPAADPLATARAMLHQIGTAPAESALEPESVPEPPAATPRPPAPPSPSVPTQTSGASSVPPPLVVEVPEGAILAANGRPFRDVDAARFKADRLSSETGEPFEARSLSPDAFIVVPLRPLDRPTPAPSLPSAPTAAAHRPAVQQSCQPPGPDEVTLEQLPDGHPAHKYGLQAYQAILKQTKKPLRQAWRSQMPLLVVAAFGVLIFLIPGLIAAAVVPPEAGPPSDTMVKGIGYAGLALAAFAFGKALFVRINHRYYLAPNYVKSEQGIVARKSTKMLYQTILSIDVHQTVIGRLLNFGSVELSCAGADGAEIMLINMFAPELVQAAIESRMPDSRNPMAFR